MAAKRDKGSGAMPKVSKKRPKSKRYQQIITLLHALKNFFLYFCIPFTIALCSALFLTWPRPALSSGVGDWRDSGYTYDYKGFTIFYQGDGI